MVSQDGAGTPDGNELIARMNSIRNVSEFHVAELHEEAQRLVDWREHVRAQPLITVGLATAAGFMVTHRVVDRGASSSHQTHRVRSAEGPPAKVSAVATMGLGLTALIGSIATSAVRTYATKLVNNLIEGMHDERRDATEDAFKW